MEDELRQRLAAAKSGKKVLDDNNALWDGVSARAARRTKLGDHITTIEDLDIIVTKDNKGFAIDKKAKKRLAGERAWKVAKPLAVYAKDINDPVLHQEINFELTDLVYCSDEDAPVRWKLIFDRASVAAVTTALTTDYGLVAGDIGAVNVARLSFLAAEPNGDAAKAARTAAVAMMKAEFPLMSLTIESIKELAVVLNDTKAELVKTIYTAFKIDDIGGRIVDAVITYKDLDTGVLLKGVSCEVLETGAKKKSSDKGLVQLKGFENGNYKLVSKKKGYVQNVTDNFAISDGSINRIEIKLKKVATDDEGHAVVNNP
jgi:hypothetical protein